VLTVEGLVKRFGGTPVLSNVSLTVRGWELAQPAEN
jgi:ABC-type branched-subunit amino acid transport system ATPase component